MTMTKKDDHNLQQVLAKIDEMDEPIRGAMLRMHQVIMAAAPDLKPRVWYGMPGYATSAGSPVLIFFRSDERMSLGLSEKVTFRPAGGEDGRLMPAAWYFDFLDDATERRVAAIVRGALQ
ncbi:MAG: DUF1801 domain-containing protein [Actinobacteria bacterium]|nr:DUF1801 domain-containing protein [Actinomycetota bacterium]